MLCLFGQLLGFPISENRRFLYICQTSNLNNMGRKIKIFLASSNELKAERDKCD